MSKLKLLVFDLDGTLAPVGKPIPPEVLEALRTLERRGLKIALSSGKPIYYLCGVMRQAGLQKPILLGENGACMQVGIDLPPKDHYILPYSHAAAQSIQLLRERLNAQMPKLWYQPNQVGLTPFFATQAENEQIGAIVEQCRDQLQDIDIYPQADCYDFTPTGISKSEGLLALGRFLGIDPAEMAAVGDGINDYPMFRTAGFSIGIHLKDASLVTANVPDITAAMSLLLEMTADKENTNCETIGI